MYMNKSAGSQDVSYRWGSDVTHLSRKMCVSFSFMLHRQLIGPLTSDVQGLEDFSYLDESLTK